ncbi:MAG TPA: NADH-quinone oxidoreductase subunit C [Dehalococcoidia bacterium]|nr:NADH-quinone oxidoreductase subunit C [Dehalococcoidia bacterium]
MPEDRRRPQDAPIVAPEPGTVADLFTALLPDVAITPNQGAMDVILMVNRDDARKVLETAKNDETLAFDFLRNLSGVDYEEQGIEVVYHLFSYKHRHNVTVRAKLPADDLSIPTVSDLWRAADWHERECRDMFGVVFDGHPNLVPILLPEDMLDHYPLRKDNPLAPLEEWQGEQLGAEMGRAGHIPPGSGFEVEASADE